jgi:hypothetical protein
MDNADARKLISYSNRNIENWNLDTKYTVAKKVSVDSFDWFVDTWKKSGWDISKDDYTNLKKIWMLAGSPFLSHIDPDTGKEATEMHYVPTSRKIDINTRTTSENKKYFFGSPDIVVLPTPEYSIAQGYEDQGPFGLLDELGHAIQFSYSTGIKGKNITGENDLSTFVASDDFKKLLRNKQIATDEFGNQFLASSKGYGKKLEFNKDLTDSTLFIMAQQLKGQPYLDKGVINIFDNPNNYDEGGRFMLRYALASHASGQWLTGEAQAHQMYAPALSLTFADLKTSGGEGDGVLSPSDISTLNKSQLGKKALENLVYQYGVGQEDVVYGSRSGVNKTKYRASSKDKTLVQYDERITTNDDRYRIAKINIDNYLKTNEKGMKDTIKNLNKWRKEYPSRRLEDQIKIMRRKNAKSRK